MVSLMKHEITRADIIPMDQYAKERRDRYRAITAVKQNRRMDIGPFATLYFESYDTMLFQVLEMLHIERGGEEQIAGELEAYNPLIPQGSELIATLMLEIDDPVRRNRELYRLAGVEEGTYIELAGQRIPGTPTEYDERTTPDGKTSSVHWLRFVFTPEQIKKFSDTNVPAILGVAHPAYGHMAVIPPQVRTELAKDFD